MIIRLEWLMGNVWYILINIMIKISEAMPSTLINYGLNNTCESKIVEINKGYAYTGEYRNIYGQLIRASNSEITWAE